jgi:hypothetical protein
MKPITHHSWFHGSVDKLRHYYCVCSVIFDKYAQTANLCLPLLTPSVHPKGSISKLV